MRYQIELHHRPTLTLLEGPSASSAMLPFKPKALPETAERELSLRVQQILAWPAQALGIRHQPALLDLGTCLTNAELRHALAKLGLKEAETTTEHELHKSGVVLAGKRHDGAKMLQKALDRRHRVAINQFARAKTSMEVRTLWQEAMQRGEIPGGYWAALTHPATSDALVREIFSAVHMLSHLMGAANRADIRRLRQLEDENAELQAKVQRQQLQLREAIVAREATIRELTQALEDSLGQSRRVESAETALDAACGALVADLKTQLSRSQSRRERIEQELAAARSALSMERDARTAAEQRENELRCDIDAIEASLATTAEIESDADLNTVGLLNATLLYVGGRPAQIGHLRHRRTLRRNILASRWRRRRARRAVAGIGQPCRRGPVSGRLRQSRCNVIGQAVLSARRQAVCAIAQRRLGAVLCCLTKSYALHCKGLIADAVSHNIR